MKYAKVDPSAPAPRQVLGWFDGDALSYPHIQRERDTGREIHPREVGHEGYERITDEEWLHRHELPYHDGTKLIARPPPTHEHLKHHARGSLQTKLHMHERKGIRMRTSRTRIATFPSDPAALVRYTSLLPMFDVGERTSVIVLDVNGLPVSLDKAHTNRLVQLTMQHQNECMQHYARLHGEVERNPHTDIDAGWPATEG